MTRIKNLRNQEVKQLRLFETDADKDILASGNGSSCFNDLSFASNKTQPVHRWVPWIAGFSSDFVRDALSKYLASRGTVLDPFAGVGTTLIEAVLQGHNAVGFEINPYANLACRTKLNAHKVNSQKMYDELLKFKNFYRACAYNDYIPKSSPPKGFKTRSPFYSAKVLRKVLIIQDFINTIEDSSLKDLFLLTFGSTMVKYSNYSYEPSLGRRESAGKQSIEDFPVGQTILNKLSEMSQDINWFQKRLTKPQPLVKIINDSFFDYEKYLSPESIDLIITSPPYLNNYHYNRNTRPQLYWLGYANNPNDLKPLELSNFGKYWQTVREQNTIALEFDLADTHLEDKLKTLRGIKPEKGIYGGKGWANYAASYFNDCYKFSKGIKYALKSGGTALVVIGNSILQGIMIPTDLYFGRIAASIGLELIKIDVPRKTRVGNSIIKSDVRVVKANSSDQLYEAIVELRKN